MNGYMGKLLLVDLSSGKISSMPLDENDTRRYVGGASLACRYLYGHLHPGLDPLGPDNPLLFMTGPLVGTAAPMCGRYEVCARSPQTGLWGEANSGGRFGPMLRFAGYDGVLLTGKAPHPMYLSIHNGEAQLHDAQRLWGKDSYEAQDLIRDELRRDAVSIACIGPAGESLVKYAAIMNDWGRAAGRTGMGAVMGSKNLKAIAAGGELQVPVTDEAALKAAARAINDTIKEDVRAQFLAAGGTASAIDTTMWMGDPPNKYFSEALWEPIANLSGATMAETILTGKKACYRCTIGCGRVTTISGPCATEQIDGPEYETVVAFGSLILSDDLSAAAYAGHLCNRFGIDTISAGVTIAFAYSLYDQGILSPADTGGLDLRWGNVDAALTLIHQIARREGFGAVLAEGTRFLGRRYGVEDQSAQVNGLEVPMHDPRAFAGMGLVYATSPRGACHNQGDMYLVDLGAPVPELDIQLSDRFESSPTKALMVARVMDWRTLYNDLIMCVFCSPPVEHIVSMINAATGWDIGMSDLLPLGERGSNLKRLLNGKLGLTAQNDRLPAILMQPLPEGPAETHVPDMDTLLAAFYRTRGWDPISGMPTAAKRQELGLDWA